MNARPAPQHLKARGMADIQHSHRWLLVALLLLSLAAVAFHPAHAAEAAQPNALTGIGYTSLPGNAVDITLSFARPAKKPLSFSIDNPARIALDFSDTQLKLKARSKQIGVGLAQSVNTAEAKGRTRVVISLTSMVNYQTSVAGNQVTIHIPGSHTTSLASSTAAAGGVFEQTAGTSAPGASLRAVKNIDFRRGPNGDGRVIITLSDPNTPVDLKDLKGKIRLSLKGTEVSKALQRRLDVTDFATPVEYVDTYSKDGNTEIIIQAHGKYEQLAYQTDNVFTVDIKPVQEQVAGVVKKQEFTGQKLSLNFQDIPVRSVLQLMADFTGLNVVVSDSVKGNLTLRLKNVPWDQALDIILKTKGLAMRKNGNVILIAPQEEIAAREKLELEAQKQKSELAPLVTEYIQVNYARAQDLADLLKKQKNSLLSPRGNVTVDPRTNTLLVQDTAEKISQIRALVNRLDVPVRQVLIESRVVIASDNFSRELGVRFGVTNNTSRTSPVTGNASITSGNLNATTNVINGETIGAPDRYNVNLPVSNPAGSIGLALTKLPLGSLLELELSAAQAEDRAEVVSSPRVITSNQTPARIESGVEIPYQQASSSGATNVSFKKAVLSLDVTPNITPDERVFMDLKVNKDSVGTIYAGVPSIDTRAINTQVLVDNGQTVVLGGIYETAKNNTVNRVPFFGDLPLIGYLFRNSVKKNDKSELLIFVTPKILNNSLATQ
ncbi:MAG: type IV pilus secretin PilQ [Gammaproteobacteria bacterium]